MKRTLKISFVLILGICFWLGISENYLSKQLSMFTKYDIENQQSSSDKDANQISFSFEEEDFHNDTFSDSPDCFCLKSYYFQKYYISEQHFPLAFPHIIWQPPKLS